MREINFIYPRGEIQSCMCCMFLDVGNVLGHVSSYPSYYAGHLAIRKLTLQL